MRRSKTWNCQSENVKWKYLQLRWQRYHFVRKMHSKRNKLNDRTFVIFGMTWNTVGLEIVQSNVVEWNRTTSNNIVSRHGFGCRNSSVCGPLNEKRVSVELLIVFWEVVCFPQKRLANTALLLKNSSQMGSGEALKRPSIPNTFVRKHWIGSIKQFPCNRLLNSFFKLPRSFKSNSKSTGFLSAPTPQASFKWCKARNGSTHTWSP